MPIPNPNCRLHDLHYESLEHIFFSYDFSEWVLDRLLTIVGGFFKAKSNFTENATEIEKLQPGSKTWGLHWTLLAVAAWSLWKERNPRNKRNKSTLKEVIYRQCARMIDIGFKVSRFKRKARLARESQALDLWDAAMVTMLGEEDE